MTNFDILKYFSGYPKITWTVEVYKPNNHFTTYLVKVFTKGVQKSDHVVYG